MRHIGLYKTIEDYYKGTSDIPENWSYISYVRTNFNTGDETIYGIKEKQNANVMWIDDYPEELDLPGEYGFDTMDEYLEDLLESNPDGDYRGANRYVYDGDTIEYEGETYYLWAYEGVGGVGCISYALTSTIDYNTLYNLSIEKDTSNRNCPIYAFLGEEMGTYKVTDYNDENYVLLKVEGQ